MKTVAFVELASEMSGVEYSTLYLASRLDRAQWDPLVLAPAEGELTARCRDAGIRVRIVPHARFFSTSLRLGKSTVVNPFAWFANGIAILSSAAALARVLRETHPALVVPKGLLAQFYGGMAARWCGIPCVWHLQDRVSDRAGFLFPFLLSLGARVFACRVIADADSIAKQIRGIVPPDRIRVIWNGVDLDEFSPAVDGLAVRAEWGIAPDEILIGSVSRLVAWKGQHVLLEAFARIASRFPNARLVFVGSALFDTDAYANALHTRAAELELGERVLFVGYRRDIPQVLSACDIFCHTALTKDSTPLAVVSALAAGKPIICSDLDGTRELFAPGEDGILVPPGDPDALADALARLLQDPLLRARLSAAARAKAQHSLDLTQFTRRCQAVFDECTR